MPKVRLTKNDIIQEITDQISSDNLNRATLRLMDFCRDFTEDREHQNDALLIRSEFSFLQKEFIRLGHSETLLRKRNEIVYKILTLIQQIDGEESAKFFNQEKENRASFKKEINKVYSHEEEVFPNEEIDIPLKKEVEVSSEEEAEISSKGEVEILSEEEVEILPKEDVENNQLIGDYSEEDSIAYVVSLDGITKKYSEFELNIESLRLKEREILGVVGRNGSGKSTLLKILASETPLTKGILKYNLKANNENEYNSKRYLFYLPQDIKDRGHINVKNYLKYCFAKNGIYGNENRNLVENVLYRFGIEEHGDKAWDELSGGYKLRLELARAYGIKPSLLILDEPLANLDVLALSKIIADIIDFTKSATSPSTVILSSQHLFEIEHISDKILYMQNGECKFFGNKQELKESKYRYYNIICDLDSNSISDIISDFCEDFSLTFDGIQYELIISNSTNVKSIFSYIALLSNEFEFYLDFTKSIKSLFIKNAYGHD